MHPGNAVALSSLLQRPDTWRGSDAAHVEQFAQQIFRQIQGFGEYGFPESHSASKVP